MKIIQHRCNSIRKKIKSNCIEIDVHLGADGELRVKHDIIDKFHSEHLDVFLEQTKATGIVVDIKQNLSVEQLQDISDIVGEKMLGFIDVPYPTLAFARNKDLLIFERYSEYEPLIGRPERIWLDPLVSWNRHKYSSLLSQVKWETRALICSPELHGREMCDVEEMWDWMAKRLICRDARIWGCITKYPCKLRTFFAERGVGI